MAANIFCGVRSLLALQMLLKKESTKQEEEGLVYMSITALIFNCVHLVYLVYIYIYIYLVYLVNLVWCHIIATLYTSCILSNFFLLFVHSFFYILIYDSTMMFNLDSIYIPSKPSKA